jgi:hypothetical protein
VEEQKLLKAKGGCSSWGVNQELWNHIGRQGFRFFRIIQVGKNSSSSDNLALSGFELYGHATTGSWP